MGQSSPRGFGAALRRLPTHAVECGVVDGPCAAATTAPSSVISALLRRLRQVLVSHIGGEGNTPRTLLQVRRGSHKQEHRPAIVIMWNDEDNNPYGTSFDRRDSQTSSSANPTSPTSRECKYSMARALSLEMLANAGVDLQTRM
jgi:hypothetical protein